jgi:hypothetical protein
VRIRAEDQRYAAQRWTRRAVLRYAASGTAGAAAASVLAGCGLFDRDPDPTPDPLEPLRLDALRLAGRYDAAVLAHPDLAARLNPIREAHLAHAAELATVIGDSSSTPSAGGPPSPPVGDARAVLAELRDAERAAQRAASDLCLAAPAGRAALVGSIAAARASHQEALR